MLTSWITFTISILVSSFFNSFAEIFSKLIFLKNSSSLPVIGGRTNGRAGAMAMRELLSLSKVAKVKL